MQKLTIKSIVERKTIQTVKGPSPKITIQANEYGNDYLSCFENDYTKTWKIGMVVEIEGVEKNGKYNNIKLIRPPKTSFPQQSAGPSQPGESMALLRSIDDGIKLLGTILQRIEANTVQQNSSHGEYNPGDDVNKPSGGSSEGGDQARDFDQQPESQPSEPPDPPEGFPF